MEMPNLVGLAASASEPLAEDELHTFRKEIDACIKKSEQFILTPKVFGREMSLVRTKLQEAKMWCGKCLEVLGSELPEQFRDKAE